MRISICIMLPLLIGFCSCGSLRNVPKLFDPVVDKWSRGDRASNLAFSLDYSEHLPTKYSFGYRGKKQDEFVINYDSLGRLSGIIRNKPFRETIYFTRSPNNGLIDTARSSKRGELTLSYNQDSAISRLAIEGQYMNIAYGYDKEITTIQDSGKISKKVEKWLEQINNYQRFISEFEFADTLQFIKVTRYISGLSDPIISATFSDNNGNLIEKFSVEEHDYNLNKYAYLIMLGPDIKKDEREFIDTKILFNIPATSFSSYNPAFQLACDYRTYLNSAYYKRMVQLYYAELKLGINTLNINLVPALNTIPISLSGLEKLSLLQMPFVSLSGKVNLLKHFNKLKPYELNLGLGANVYKITPTALTRPLYNISEVLYFELLSDVVKSKLISLTTSVKILGHVSVYEQGNNIFSYADWYVLPEATISAGIREDSKILLKLNYSAQIASGSNNANRFFIQTGFVLPIKRMIQETFGIGG